MTANLAATTIVYNTNKERLLLVKRADERETNPGKWEFPGGGVKDDETPKEAALRELKEETGLKGEIVRSGTPGKIDTHIGKIEIHPFLVRTETEEIELSREHTAYQWIKKQELQNFDTVEGIEKEISALGIEL